MNLSGTPEDRGLALGTRWLGVGLASCIAVTTIALALTGQIGLYINPDASWWAVSMSVVLLLGAVASCAFPVRGDAHDHAHDHAHDSELPHSDVPAPVAAPELVPPVALTRAEARAAAAAAEAALQAAPAPARPPRALWSSGLTLAGGGIASVFALAALVLPPTSLSAELALARSTGAAPQLSGSATLQLAAAGDTSAFGVGEWSSLLATTTDPTAYVGDEARLTGFVGPADEDGRFLLTRLVVVHCVIDAQAASVPVLLDAQSEDLEVGQWVNVAAEFVADDAGGLVLSPTTIEAISEPGDPYEY